MLSHLFFSIFMIAIGSKFKIYENDIYDRQIDHETWT